MLERLNPRPVQFLGTGPEERRGWIRQDTLFTAEAIVEGDHRLVCYVRNVSPMGALLEFDPTDAQKLPRAFRIEIDEIMFSADCELRHLAGGFCGISFMSNRLDALTRFGGLQG